MKLPITLQEIKLELGISGNEVDGVIECGMVAVCIQAGAVVTDMTDTLRKRTDAEFRAHWEKVAAFDGLSIASIKATDEQTRVIRFVPQPKTIQRARTAVLAWCMDQDDIRAVIAQQGAHYAIAAE